MYARVQRRNGMLDKGRKGVTQPKRWRIIEVTVLSALLACTLAACASGSQSGAGQTSTKQTLTLSALTTYQPGLTPIIKEFEQAYPNITIKPTFTAATPDYISLLSTEFAGGNAPDVVMLLPGSEQVWPYAQHGYLVDLSDASWAKDTTSSAKPVVSYQGKIYAQDDGSQAWPVSYNEEYFSTHHLQVPTTFSQLLSLCRSIASTGEIPIAYAGGNGPSQVNSLDSVVGSTVFDSQPDWMALRQANKTTFASTPGWVTAAREFVQMQNAKCFEPGVAGVQIPDMQSEFGSGKAAMMFSSTALDAGVTQTNPSLRIGMFPVPGVTAQQTRVSVITGDTLAISAKSQHIAAAEQFLDFVASPKEAAQYAQANNLLSPAQERSGKLPAAYAGLAKYYENGLTVPTRIWEWPNSQFSTLAGQQMVGLFTGQLSVQQFVSSLDSDWDA